MNPTPTRTPAAAAPGRARPHLSRALSALALAAGLLAAGPVSAAPTVNSAWVATWDLCGQDCYVISDSAGGVASGGDLVIDQSMPKNSGVRGAMSLDFDAAQGRLRSSTQVRALVDQLAAPDTLSWDRMLFFASNQVHFDDQLVVDHDGFGFMKIVVRTTGSLHQQGLIIEAPISYADVSQLNRLIVDAEVAGIDRGGFTELIQNHYVGLSDGVFAVDESLDVHRLFELIVPWEDDVPVTFSFRYDEVMQYMVDGVDASRVEMSGENRFGHTLELFADVYDSAGNWLQGVTVGSSEGIGYASLGPDQPGTVPEPSSLALAGCAALGWFARRRRRS